MTSNDRFGTFLYHVSIVSAVALVLFAILLLVSGCASQEQQSRDPLVIARQLKAMGVEADATIIYGSGHWGGVSINVTGSSGVIHAKFKPSEELDIEAGDEQ